MLKIKIIIKLGTILITQGNTRGAAYSMCSLKYNIPKEISIVFHNGSNYDYCVIIKELAEEFEKQFTCFQENTEK